MWYVKRSFHQFLTLNYSKKSNSFSFFLLLSKSLTFWHRKVVVFFNKLNDWLLFNSLQYFCHLINWIIHLFFAVLQALIAPDFKHLKMSPCKDMLVVAAVFAILGLTQCQKLPSKFTFFHTYLTSTAYLSLHKKEHWIISHTMCSFYGVMWGWIYQNTIKHF